MAAPAPPTPAGPRRFIAWVAAWEPLIRLDSLGERVSALGATLLLAGAAWLLVQPPADPAHLPATALLAVAMLAFLQAVSTVTPLGKFLVAGASALLGIAGALAVWLAQPGGLGAPMPPGVGLALLGAAGSALGMEGLRAEAAASYRLLALRAVTLAQSPSVHLAALKFALPFALAGFAVLAVAELGPEKAAKFAAIFLQYFFNPVGKEVAIGCGLASCPPLVPGPPLHPLEVAPFLVFIDAVTALFLAWNYRYVMRVPYLGRVLRWVEEHGRKTVDKRAWIRRLAFFGVMLYAAGPFEGTGAIGGTIVGRTIGLDAARTWASVTLGSVLRTTILVLTVTAGLHLFEQVQARGLGAEAVAVVAALAVLVGLLLLWRRRRARAAPEPGRP